MPSAAADEVNSPATQVKLTHYPFRIGLRIAG